MPDIAHFHCYENSLKLEDRSRLGAKFLSRLRASEGGGHVLFSHVPARLPCDLRASRSRGSNKNLPFESTSSPVRESA